MMYGGSLENGILFRPQGNSFFVNPELGDMSKIMQRIYEIEEFENPADYTFAGLAGKLEKPKGWYFKYGEQNENTE